MPSPQLPTQHIVIQRNGRAITYVDEQKNPLFVNDAGLCLKPNQVVEWTCDEEFSIDFPGDTPFQSNRYEGAAGVTIETIVIEGRTRKDPYKFCTTVFNAHLKQRALDDPRIFVN